MGRERSRRKGSWAPICKERRSTTPRWRGWDVVRGHRAREGQRGPERGQRARQGSRQSRKRGRRLLPASVLSPLPTDRCPLASAPARRASTCDIGCSCPDRHLVTRIGPSLQPYAQSIVFPCCSCMHKHSGIASLDASSPGEAVMLSVASLYVG